jgi:hypothetical protein
MYWMLTGRHVFDVPTVARMLAAHVHVEPEPPNRRGAAIPAALETVVLRCLAKSRDDRFGSAEELLAALDSVPLEAPWSSSRAAAWWRDHGLEPVSGRAP